MRAAAGSAGLTTTSLTSVPREKQLFALRFDRRDESDRLDDDVRRAAAAVATDSRPGAGHS